MSLSCKLASKLCASSSMELFKSKKSARSFSTCFILACNSSICLPSSSISRLLPKMLTVLLTTEPPVIEPDGLIKSPFKVTIRNAYWFFFARLMAVSISSTITVLPSKLNTICSYFFSYWIKSDAIPITLASLSWLKRSNFFP